MFKRVVFTDHVLFIRTKVRGKELERSKQEGN